MRQRQVTPEDVPQPSQVLPWSAGLMFLIALFGTRFFYGATWLQAFGLGVLLGIACALGSWRGLRRLNRRLE